MPGTMTVRALPMNNNTYPVSVSALGLIPLTRYSVRIGPVTTDPPTQYGHWAASSQFLTDDLMLTENRVKGPGGQSLSFTFLCPGHYGATPGDPVYLGLFGGTAFGSSDPPQVVLLVGEICDWF